ncbi:MAG: phosphatidate cytidylyltransferase [Candidatus Berkiella sp.]
MLKWRLLTALCLIPLVILGILKLDDIPFACLCGAILALGAHEWTSLVPFTKKSQQIGYTALFMVFCASLFFVKSLMLLWVALVFWLSCGIGLYRYKGLAPLWLSIPVKALLGLLILCSAFYGLVTLHRMSAGPIGLIVCLVLIWSTDSFAYFTGRLIGKRPMAPLISPKKTKEGFWGGMIGTVTLAAVGSYFTQVLPQFSLGHTLWVAIVIVLLAVIGDLFESFMKRLAGVKDSGKLLPGHGGILDRLDSLFAVIPFFVLVMHWLEKGS